MKHLLSTMAPLALGLAFAASPATAVTTSTQGVQCRVILQPYTGPADQYGTQGYMLVAQFQVLDMPYPKDFVVRGALTKDGKDVRPIINKLPQAEWKRGEWAHIARLRVGRNPGFKCNAMASWTKAGTALAVAAPRQSVAVVRKDLPLRRLGPLPLALPDGSRVDDIGGKREGIAFRRGNLYQINGKGLAGGTAAWLLGPNGGGTALQIVTESDTRLLVKVTDIAGAKTPWPAGRSPQRHADTLRMRIEAAYGQRLFEFEIPRSVYICKSGDPNCSRD